MGIVSCFAQSVSTYFHSSFTPEYPALTGYLADYQISGWISNYYGRKIKFTKSLVEKTIRDSTSKCPDVCLSVGSPICNMFEFLLTY